MSRRWTELVAAVGDRIPLGLAALLLFLLAGLVAAALYWWPAWLPWRWWPRRVPGAGRRWRLHWSWRWRRRPRRSRPAEKPDEPVVVDEELPDLPTEAFVSLADQLAAQGRFAEAVRERLRGIIRELVDRHVVPHQPGSTITELAAMAGTIQPSVRPPLDAACQTFSEIWYGQRPATAVHDGQMRGRADEVHAALLSTAGERR